MRTTETARKWRATAAAAAALPLMLLTLALVPAGKPEDAGMSSERLTRIARVAQDYVDSGQITGAVSVVARRGKIVYFEPTGYMDLGSRTPMRKDAIFRMASMSKPVTGVAILMLMEEGKVRLTQASRAAASATARRHGARRDTAPTRSRLTSRASDRARSISSPARNGLTAFSQAWKLSAESSRSHRGRPSISSSGSACSIRSA